MIALGENKMIIREENLKMKARAWVGKVLLLRFNVREGREGATQISERKMSWTSEQCEENPYMLTGCLINFGIT